MQIKGNTTYSQEDNQLTAHLTLDIPNAQIATFIPDWNKVNQALISGTMDKEEYDMWLVLQRTFDGLRPLFLI